MRKFDTKVQLLKYKVLREVARIAFDEESFPLPTISMILQRP